MITSIRIIAGGRHRFPAAFEYASIFGNVSASKAFWMTMVGSQLVGVGTSHVPTFRKSGETVGVMSSEVGQNVQPARAFTLAGLVPLSKHEPRRY